MHRTIPLLALLGLLAGASAGRLWTLEHRLARLESRPAASPASLVSLRTDLTGARRRLAAADRRLDALSERLAESREAGRRLQRVEQCLAETRTHLRSQVEELAFLSSTTTEAAYREIGEELRTLVGSLEQRWGELESEVRSLEGSLALEGPGTSRSGYFTELDPVRAWGDLLGPTVQLWGATTVGSGILLPSRRVEGGDGWRTYVLTAWHVVRDIRHEDEDTPISTKLYRRSGAKRFETSSLVAWDADLDLALLLLDLDERLPFGARLPRRESLEAIQIFHPVYAVGCPLGNDPIPTLGEVSDLHHHVDGQSYWMVSAPTYVGNSGGGIFDAETHELLGVFTKIYTHGTLRPIVVPHMGLATPLECVYDWLDSVGHGSLTGSGEPDAVARAGE